MAESIAGATPKLPTPRPRMNQFYQTEAEYYATIWRCWRDPFENQVTINNPINTIPFCDSQLQIALSCKIVSNPNSNTTWHTVRPRRRRPLHSSHSIPPPYQASSTVSTGGKPSTLSISTASTLSSSSTPLVPCWKRRNHSFRVTFDIIKPQI